MCRRRLPPPGAGRGGPREPPRRPTPQNAASAAKAAGGSTAPVNAARAAAVGAGADEGGGGREALRNVLDPDGEGDRLKAAAASMTPAVKPSRTSRSRWDGRRRTRSPRPPSAVPAPAPPVQETGVPPVATRRPP